MSREAELILDPPPSAAPQDGRACTEWIDIESQAKAKPSS
jgi:hypothetical protein